MEDNELIEMEEALKVCEGTKIKKNIHEKGYTRTNTSNFLICEKLSSVVLK